MHQDNHTTTIIINCAQTDKDKCGHLDRRYDDWLIGLCAGVYVCVSNRDTNHVFKA